jgi:hypothetical protein
MRSCWDFEPSDVESWSSTSTSTSRRRAYLRFCITSHTSARRESPLLLVGNRCWDCMEHQLNMIDSSECFVSLGRDHEHMAWAAVRPASSRAKIFSFQGRQRVCEGKSLHLLQLFDIRIRLQDTRWCGCGVDCRATITLVPTPRGRV